MNLTFEFVAQNREKVRSLKNGKVPNTSICFFIFFPLFFSPLSCSQLSKYTCICTYVSVCMYLYMYLYMYLPPLLLLFKWGFTVGTLWRNIQLLVAMDVDLFAFPFCFFSCANAYVPPIFFLLRMRFSFFFVFFP